MYEKKPAKTFTEYLWEYEGYPCPYNYQRIFYVDDTGNDTWPGTAAQPFRTLQKAYSMFANADSQCVIRCFPAPMTEGRLRY